MNAIRRNMPAIRRIMEQAERDIVKESGVRVKLFLELNEASFSSADELISTCCQIWDVEEDDLRERTRKREIVQMRYVLSLLLNVRTALTLTEIAHKVGYNDHTDVIHARTSAVKHRSANDAMFMQFYNPVKHLFDETEVEQ